MQDKIKHLEMIQAVITRMASNSFAIKGWAVTLVAALLGFCTQTTTPKLVFIAMVPAILFWWLDGFYLMQERLYRNLYERIRTDAVAADFSMNASAQRGTVCCSICTMFSMTLIVFHLPNVLVAMAVTLYVLTK